MEQKIVKEKGKSLYAYEDDFLFKVFKECQSRRRTKIFSFFINMYKTNIRAVYTDKNI